MRLCTKCNRLLKNSDTYCPYCAQDAADAAELAAAIQAEPAATAQPAPEPADPPRAEPPAEPTGKPETAIGVSYTLEIPFADFEAEPPKPETKPAESAPEPFTFEEAEPEPAQEDRLSVEKILAAPVVPAGQRVEPHDVTMEIPIADDPANDGILDERDFQRGHIEREMDDVDEPHRGGIGKLGVTLIAILIVVALTFGFLIYRKASAPPPAPTDDTMIALVSGKWVSDKFSFSDNSEKLYVELLTLDFMGTFDLQILEVDKIDPTGYLDGGWKVYQQVGGTYEAQNDSKDLILKYNDETGAEKIVIRNVQSVTDGKMTLRDFYNDARTDYYDLAFTKIK